MIARADRRALIRTTLALGLAALAGCGPEGEGQIKVGGKSRSEQNEDMKKAAELRAAQKAGKRR